MRRVGLQGGKIRNKKKKKKKKKAPLVLRVTKGKGTKGACQTKGVEQWAMTRRGGEKQGKILQTEIRAKMHILQGQKKTEGEQRLRVPGIPRGE